MIRTSAPLKLVIAGEWAVQEPNTSGIVAAINNRLFCEIEPNPQGDIEISLLDFDLKNLSAKYTNNELVFNHPISQEAENHLKIIKFTIETALFLLDEFKPFKIKTWCEYPDLSTDSETKLGLGSSAAAVVAILGAIRAFHNITLDNAKDEDHLFKLCLLTHFIVQGMKGSGIDIAACFYGGILRYKPFDRNWVLSKIQNDFPFDLFVEYTWPDLSVEFFPKFPELHLLLGWTQIPASTSHLISQMEKFKEKNHPLYQNIIQEITKLVKDLTKALKKQKKNEILSHIRINEMHLRRLGEITGVAIEIPKLKILSQVANGLGGAGKLSGAGGGDCGIAICFEEDICNKILQEWGKHGIVGGRVFIDYVGLRIERF